MVKKITEGIIARERLLKKLGQQYWLGQVAVLCEDASSPLVPKE